MTQDKLLIGVTSEHTYAELLLSMANRHGLITGATGTGKTVTLQRLAQQFSQAGIPVFMTDVKGDIAGLAYPGIPNPKILDIFTESKLTYTPEACPVTLWDLYGKQGHPLRTTISDLGPLLLGRILEANTVQQGIINAAFSLADDQGLLLLDLKDFRSLLNWVLSHANQLKAQYGNFSNSSVAAIQRSLLTLAESGGDNFFGEPALKLEHLMQKNHSGQGMISILDATQLILDPRLYSTFLLWLLSELFEQLPETGDLAKPKLIFFFDEAHLFFDSAPKSLLEKIEQVVRLIRSKGVGVFFVTQNPGDITENVLSQLSNRVQHALRAFTPKDQKNVKAAAQTFRQNPKLNTEKMITELGVGEALVSFLDINGTPVPVEKVKIIPPESRMGAISEEERKSIISRSLFGDIYDQCIDRESAYEMIKQKITKEESQSAETEVLAEKIKTTKTKAPVGRPRQSISEIFIKSTARALGSKLGQKIIRGILGSISTGKKSS